VSVNDILWDRSNDETAVPAFRGGLAVYRNRFDAATEQLQDDETHHGIFEVLPSQILRCGRRGVLHINLHITIEN